MVNNNKTKPSFVPWTEVDTSLGPGSKFPFFITDTVAAGKGNVFIWTAPAEAAWEGLSWWEDPISQTQLSARNYSKGNLIRQPSSSVSSIF